MIRKLSDFPWVSCSFPSPEKAFSIRILVTRSKLWPERYKINLIRQASNNRLEWVLCVYGLFWLFHSCYSSALRAKDWGCTLKSLFVLLGMMIEKRNASVVITVYIGYRKSLLFIIHCALKAINAFLTKKSQIFLCTLTYVILKISISGDVEFCTLLQNNNKKKTCSVRPEIYECWKLIFILIWVILWGAKLKQIIRENKACWNVHSGRVVLCEIFMDNKWVIKMKI